MEWYLFTSLICIFLIIGWFTTTGIKSQWVRLVDIFILGPLLIWTATRVDNTVVQLLLIAFGATTISYNARNWFHNAGPKNVSISHPASWS